jgi:hypothetical protein
MNMKNMKLLSLVFTLGMISSAHATDGKILTSCISSGIHVSYAELENDAIKCCESPSGSTGLPAGRALLKSEAVRLHFTGFSTNLQNYTDAVAKLPDHDEMLGLIQSIDKLGELNKNVIVTCERTNTRARAQ